MITRDEALEVLKKYNKSENLVKHGLIVEAVMRHFAKLNEEDENKWGIIGLIHDVDYEMYPDNHCIKAKDILSEHGFSEEYIRAVQSHGYNICCDVEPVHKMEKVLYTIDELTGLVVATALMKPTKSVYDVDLKSLKKKWKQKNFAAGVDREIIQKGADMLGLEMEYVMQETINGIRNIASEIGLAGDKRE